MEKKITSPRGGQINVLLSGKSSAPIIVVFVHGFGAGMHEDKRLFTDIAQSLGDEFTTLQFDFCGYGGSGGSQQDVSLTTMSEDLDAVLKYAKDLHKRVFILAHSLGAYVVAKLLPRGVERIICTGFPGFDSLSLAGRIQKRITENGGELNVHSVSTYRRTNGETQKVGPQFWVELYEFKARQSLQMLALLAPLAVVVSSDDEVTKGFTNFADIEMCKAFGIQFRILEGDHNFTRKNQRLGLEVAIDSYFRSVWMVFIAHQISGLVESNIAKVINISKQIHSHNIIPAFPILLWRNYLDVGDPLISGVNTAYFSSGAIQQIRHYGPNLSQGMLAEAELAMNFGIPNTACNDQIFDQLVSKFVYR